MIEERMSTTYRHYHHQPSRASAPRAPRYIRRGVARRGAGYTSNLQRRVREIRQEHELEALHRRAAAPRRAAKGRAMSVPTLDLGSACALPDLGEDDIPTEEWMPNYLDFDLDEGVLLELEAA